MKDIILTIVALAMLAIGFTTGHYEGKDTTYEKMFQPNGYWPDAQLDKILKRKPTKRKGT